MLQHLSARLAAGEPIEQVMQRFAEAFVDIANLSRCEVVSEFTETPVEAERVTASDNHPAAPQTIPMTARDRRVGHLVAVSAAADGRIGDDERQLVDTFAGQMALAVEGMQLAVTAREAQMEAETNKLRAALFSSVTHDLRTPLASITASVTSLLDPAASFGRDDREDLLATIKQEAERLNRLVGNLLDLSRLRAGALVPTRSLVAIDELVEGVLARLEPTLRGHTVRLLAREDVPEISADVVQVDQLLTNVLENAAKFSPTGSQIAISTTLWQGRVRVSVADQGRGIPEADREQVFEPFVRGIATDGAGTGLGLSIARAVAVAHGGSIWIETAPGGGTAVVFELPIEPGNGAAG
jgi:two-component system sensor histidine kinase KdpD